MGKGALDGDRIVALNENWQALEQEGRLADIIRDLCNAPSQVDKEFKSVAVIIIIIIMTVWDTTVAWLIMARTLREDERLVSKMEGRTSFSRRLKQFDGLTDWLRDPTFYDRSMPMPDI